MVTYLHLDTQMENTFIKGSNTLTWEVDNIDFEKCTNIALASLTLYFPNRMPCMQISTNLIQPNQFNPEGILSSIPALKVGEHIRIPNLIYWKLDSTTPRVITLKFHKVNISSLKFASVVLALD